jgi:hypothetical protein
MQAMQSARVAMNAAQQCVIVKAPVDRVYEQWSRIEELPKFITPLRDVRRIDDAHFSYSWHPNGQDEQGIFHIILRIPGRRFHVRRGVFRAAFRTRNGSDAKDPFDFRSSKSFAQSGGVPGQFQKAG